ncbi:xanthine dehydrogenase molybdopterin binding subunit [Alteromonas sp. a30]|uniref:xanthine dehydrogenase molybdopterin binding subunit n=1 Tax=Alteromonas sp. a30 TaxID=2730917 RepID=UPI002281A19A|nr:xanthine dehydrogenase molybdopterin binding subunit [Alteromonas sp. a30]MCY7293886.1 xanthine dehydrogenase molybdopterin binding subunit [Alteromonas sp. a30]
MRKLITPKSVSETQNRTDQNLPKDKLSVAHESAIQHVTGSASYIDDLPEPQNTRYAAIGLTQHAKGKITRLNLDPVRQAPGVIDVIDINDIPGHTDIGPVFKGDPILADHEIRFHGQALFAVLANSVREARQAALLAHYELEEETPILSVEHAHAENTFVRPVHTMSRGDHETAIQNSEHQISGSLTIGGQEHLYLEGQAALAIPSDNSSLIVYSSTQHPSEVQKLIAEVLDWRLHKVNVEIRRMGGAFGGKETQAAQWACLASVLAVRNQCAVKLRLPRAQDMQVTGKRHPFSNHYQVGFNKEGVIQGSNIHINGNCGHSPDLSDAIVDRAMFHCDNAYYLGDCYIEGHRCQTNQVSHTAFRGFGGPQGMIMGEAIIDRIARVIGEDPLTVRKRNYYNEQRNQTHYGMEVEHFSLPQLVQQLEEKSDYWTRREAITVFNNTNPFVKKGLALTPVKFGISFTAQLLNQAGALVHIYTDGSLQVNHGGTEMGQGLHTKIQQIAAHEFGLPLNYIEVTATRTDKVPNTSPTAASSGTDLNGKAVQNACITLKQRLADFISEKYEVSAQSVTFENGKVIAGALSFEFAKLIQDAYVNRIQLSANGFYKTPKIHYARSTGKGRPFFYFANGAAVSEVTLDTLTGEYKVERVDILHDVGNSINPSLDIGQIEGGFIQGMGWLTTEELVWDEKGRLLSQNPATYKIPAIGDLPKIFNVELFDQANPEDTIYHSKAVGEPPFMLAISVWSAIKDAISSLSNYQIDPDLHPPATPEAVLKAIQSIASKTDSKDKNEASQ